MTAPDHTPYLLATDLRTPEDVVRWQREQVADGVGAAFVLVAITAARLDRERRQACRRGARYHIVQARAHHDDAARWPTLPATNWDTPAELAEYVAVSLRCMQDSTQRALAFRSAARAE